jgi:hypothetical protein
MNRHLVALSVFLLAVSSSALSFEQATAGERPAAPKAELDDSLLDGLSQCSVLAHFESILFVMSRQGTYDEQLPKAQAYLDMLPPEEVARHLKEAYAVKSDDLSLRAMQAFARCVDADGLPVDPGRAGQCYEFTYHMVVLVLLAKDTGKTIDDHLGEFDLSGMEPERAGMLEQRVREIWQRGRTQADIAENQRLDARRLARCALLGADPLEADPVPSPPALPAKK